MFQGFQDLELTTTRVGSETTVSVSGDIDLASAAALRSSLAGEVDGATGDVEIDLSRVSFCDSVGLEALLAASRDLQAAGRTMRILDPASCVIRLLQLTASSHRFQIVTTDRSQ